MTVDAEHRNAFESLHGGAVCLLIDVVGTLALLTKDATRPGVSVELNCSFLSPAMVGDEIEVTGRVLRYGKRLGFTQVDIVRVKDNKLVATGRHTKAFAML